MPYAVAIDSIYFSKSLFSGEKVTTVRILDPPFIVNYYRLVYFINKIQQKIFYILDDGLFREPLSGTRYSQEGAISSWRKAILCRFGLSRLIMVSMSIFGLPEVTKGNRPLRPIPYLTFQMGHWAISMPAPFVKSRPGLTNKQKEYISYTQGNPLNLSIGKQSKLRRVKKKLIKIYETTMRKSFSHRRMIIGSPIWQIKNKIINR